MKYILLLVMLAGCSANPPLPLDLPKPAAALMVPASKTPMPILSEKQSVTINSLYLHAVKVQSQCVMDRTRLDHLQKYVRGLHDVR